jgi:MurNAc alpha-1-phosphate uridylyltransferase
MASLSKMSTPISAMNQSFLGSFPAMILAAGRGERMRPLTDTVPKPLLEIHGKSLLSYHLNGLAKAGFEKVVINHAWLGHCIEEQIQDGSSFGLSVKYSAEEVALETAGGIAQALHIMQPQDYFLVINGDTFMPLFPFDQITNIVDRLREDIAEGLPTLLAYLFLVPNPPHHPQGDFYLNPPFVFSDDQLANNALSQQRYTFSGAGIYHRSLFSQITPPSKAALAPILRKAMGSLLVEGEILRCAWHDVGTPDRLLALNQQR